MPQPRRNYEMSPYLRDLLSETRQRLWEYAEEAAHAQGRPVSDEEAQAIDKQATAIVQWGQPPELHPAAEQEFIRRRVREMLRAGTKETTARQVATLELRGIPARPEEIWPRQYAPPGKPPRLTAHMLRVGEERAAAEARESPWMTWLARRMARLTPEEFAAQEAIRRGETGTMAEIFRPVAEAVRPPTPVEATGTLLGLTAPLPTIAVEAGAEAAGVPLPPEFQKGVALGTAPYAPVIAGLEALGQAAAGRPPTEAILAGAEAEKAAVMGPLGLEVGPPTIAPAGGPGQAALRRAGVSEKWAKPLGTGLEIGALMGMTRYGVPAAKRAAKRAAPKVREAFREAARFRPPVLGGEPVPGVMMGATPPPEIPAAPSERKGRIVAYKESETAHPDTGEIGTLRDEWRIRKTTVADRLPLRERFGERTRPREYLLEHRYIRRGVEEPWEITDQANFRQSLLGQVDPRAVAVDPSLKALQTERHATETARQEREKVEAEATARREAAHKAHIESDAAFIRMAESPRFAGLAVQWNEMVNREMAEGTFIHIARQDAAFKADYDPVLAARTVPAKAKAIKRFLANLEGHRRRIMGVRPPPGITAPPEAPAPAPPKVAEVPPPAETAPPVAVAPPPERVAAPPVAIPAAAPAREVGPPPPGKPPEAPPVPPPPTVTAPPPSAPVPLEGPIGIKNVAVDAQLANLGLPPARHGEKYAIAQAGIDAVRRMQEDPRTGTRLVQTLKANPRPPTGAEDLLLDAELTRLDNEVVTARAELTRAKESGDPVAIADANTRASRALEDYAVASEVVTISGTESSYSLGHRRAMMNRDYSLAHMVLKKKVAKGDRPLTPAETAEVAEQSKKIAALRETVDRLQAEKADREREIEIPRAIVKMTEKVKAEDAADLNAGRRRAVPQEKAAILEGLRKATTEALAPTTLRRYIQGLAEAFLRSGVRGRDALLDAVHGEIVKIMPDMSRRQTMDAISGYGDFRALDLDPIKAELRDIKGQLQQIGKLEDMEAGAAPKKTGWERPIMSDVWRRLVAKVKEKQRQAGFVVTDPAKQLKSALDSIKTRLRHEISDLDAQIATGKKLISKKTGVTYDAEALALKAQRDALRVQFDEIFGKPEMTDAQRVKVAIAAVQRSIRDIESRIASKDYGPRTRASKTPDTPELLAVRAKRTALGVRLQELRFAANPRKTPDEIARQAYKTRLVNRGVELWEKLARRDFTEKPPREELVDSEITQMRFDLDKIQRAYNEGLIRDRMARRSPVMRAVAVGGEVLNSVRILMTSFDLSAVLRQGGFVVLGHPVRGARAILPMLRAAMSERGQFAIEEAIRGRPNAHMYKRAGLFLSERGQTLAQMEEAYMSRWAEKIPVLRYGIGASQRAYTTFLNLLRADSFDAMAKSLSRDGNVTLPEAKAIANFVNVATGRGTVAGMEQAAVVLNSTFFAPRYLMSRFQLVVGEPLLRGTWGTKKLIAKEYGRFLTGLGVVYGLGVAAGGNIETDPRSSDFGKVRFGDTRLDPLSGIAQITTLAGRLWTGETKRPTGEIVPIRGPGVPYGGETGWDVLARFARTKLSPTAGMVTDYMAGEDVVGKPVTWKTMAARPIPMSLRDTYEAMQREGIPEGTALGLLGLLGMGLQTYSDKRTATQPSGSDWVRQVSDVNIELPELRPTGTAR